MSEKYKNKWFVTYLIYQNNLYIYRLLENKTNQTWLCLENYTYHLSFP